MLALRLTRGARPAVLLRRTLVALASAGTGFLLLCVLGHALIHPEAPAGAALRLAWCAVPLAATVHFAVAVARTDPATRPRPGLSAVGLGPGRLMAVSAATTALSCLAGSALALLLFVDLRGGVTGAPSAGGPEFLATGEPLPLPATLTLLAMVPAASSLAAALVLRPRAAVRPARRDEAHTYGRFGAYGRAGTRETFGAYGRFGARLRRGDRRTGGRGAKGAADAPDAVSADAPTTAAVTAAPTAASANAVGVETFAVPRPVPDASAVAVADGPAVADALADADALTAPVPRPAPGTLPWGVAVLAAGLAVETYASRTAAGSGLVVPGGLSSGPVGVLGGWLMTAFGLALAGPGLVHLCGRLLQAVRPGALRLLAGRVLMTEANRIGRPLGVVCAVIAGGYATAALAGAGRPSLGPLVTLGGILVTGCTVATLLTAAVEARQDRADTTAALVRLGAPATVLRWAAALRAGVLIAVFGPLTLVISALAATPLAR
ncbi:hypothetical protein [Streptomyces sp. NPDC008150]|uniref:hypothetical protein n=1 Tax=Streptomyces sp. NPDC008150 TaxID=3364816 RepID=UPI0036E14284